jgi:acyl carrier protein
MSDDFQKRVIDCIARTQHLDPASITLASTFEELKIDSLDGINILFALENEFNVNIPDDAAKQVRTVGELAEGLHKLIAASAAS